MKPLLSILFFISLFSTGVFGKIDSTIYSKDLKLKDGLYLTFSDFKSNHPIPKARIISNYNKNSLDFFKQELSKTEIKYTDSTNTMRTIKTGKVWGYCSDNNIYINYGREFSKIMVVGSICHFTAFVEVVLGGAYNPYMNSPTGMRSGYELQQFIMDFYSGQVGDYTVSNLEVLLN